MVDLLAAWSLSGRELTELLPDAAWHRMIATLASAPAATGRRAGRLRLHTGGALAEVSGELRAGLGSMLPGLADVADTTNLDGHHVTLSLSPDGERLTLTRSLSGGEHLYLARRGELLLIASTVRPLLAHPAIAPAIRTEVLDEVLLCGLVSFGDETLFAGITELRPGHALAITDAIGPSRWMDPAALGPAAGSRRSLGRGFRDALTEAVVAAAGPRRPVPVALSGGIDSSAIAACAVDAFGADGVEALTYEFDDPTHGTELDYARLVAERLGIRRHHVFKLREADFLAAIPEMVWRSESLVHWPKAFMLPVARELAARGHDRVLTGFGIGSHMGWCREVAEGLRRLGPGPLVRSWLEARFGFSPWPARLRRLHPALEPPHPRIHHAVVRLLHARGQIPDPARFFPPDLHPLIATGRPVAAREDLDGELGSTLQRVLLSHLMSCIDVTRSEKASRELGVLRIAPAHFRRCLPFAYFPVEPRPRLYSEARRLRPGKLLLREGFRGTLPDEVLFRVKSWGDAVASPRWLRAGRRLMLSALIDFPSSALRYGEPYASIIPRWEARSLLATGLALRLLERVLIDTPPSPDPPTWESLGALISPVEALIEP